MQIGAGFTKLTKETSRTYISIVINKELKAINPCLKDIIENNFISLYFVPENDRKNEKSPAWILDISEKPEKKDNDLTENSAETDILKPQQEKIKEEIPF